MSACVSESSYNIMFAVSLTVSIILLLSSIYYYGKFKQAANSGNFNNSTITQGSTIALVLMIVSVILLGLNLFIYLGLQHRMMAIYNTV